MAQVEIARRIGVSTASVSRLLQKARALGMVKIEMQDLPSLEETTRELGAALGLKRAAVIEAPSVEALGALAASVDALIKDEGLQSGSVVGIGWGRAVREVLVAGLSPLFRSTCRRSQRWNARVRPAFPNQRVCTTGGGAIRRVGSLPPCSVSVLLGAPRRAP
jgi:DNA-binding transcriptional regulator LsrR (DeoR family)